jgi:hypothetical protein
MTRFRVLGHVTALVLLVRSASGQALITEFQASNKSTILDEDGDASDWIELYNPGPTPLDLLGWSLTDDAQDLTRWQFPARALGAGERLVVFASAKDRAPPAGELHTSFKLESSGEYLALVKPDGATIAQEYSPAYPPQRDNVSFGFGDEALEPPLVAVGAKARVLVPSSGALGTSWTGGSEPFDDSAARGWIEGPTGLGDRHVGRRHQEGEAPG